MGTAETLLVQIARGPASELERRLLGELSTGHPSVLFCNVHMLMLAQRDAELGAAMEGADLLIPDGVPLAWLQRRLGVPGAEVFRGYQAMQVVCAEAAGQGRPIGLFGASDDVLEQLERRLCREHAGLKVAYRHAPPFAEGVALDLDESQVETVNALGLQCLFVGLGCPKQEKWLARHRGRLGCALLGVGAAFGWLAGTSRMPPLWMERGGLAWLHRLLEDPRRMWRRYLVYNTQFLIFAAKVLASRSKLDIKNR